MKNDDEFLKQQATLLMSLRKACRKLTDAMLCNPEEACNALGELFSTVDAMRASAKPATVYIPAMGEGVLVEGLVEKVDEDTGVIIVRFGEGPADYLWINPKKNVVMPL